MAATPAAAARDPTPTEVRRRISKAGAVAGPARDAAEERPPVNKKVKLAYPGSTGNTTTTSVAEETPRFIGGDWRMGGERVAPQHHPNAPLPPSVGGSATANGANATGRTAQTTAQRYLDPKSLQNLRETISQQFDIEILLKHRELGLIEQEIAKTQICIEQLRRCTVKPYQSPEISLEPYIPDAKQLENGPPDYSPPHWSVVNGPYTRHYQQWLLPDPTFDGYGPEGPPQVVLPAGKGTRSQKTVEQTQTYTVSGRPQRQSVMKVQQRGGAGMQQCIFRKNDGTTVRLECLDCKRSDFSSAQGFINHCRIAHQREYASHEAAAQACGQLVEETEEGFALYPRNPVDPPSRNTRQTQQTVSPQSSYSSTPRGSLSGPSGVPIPSIPPPKIVQTPKNKTTAAQRKNGNRGTRAVMTTSRSAEGFRRPPTPPIDAPTFKTPHLEGLLKRKKIEVDLATMVKEVKGERINWDDHTYSEEDDDESDQSETSVLSRRDTDGDTVMTDGPPGKEEHREVRRFLGTETHAAMVATVPESLTVTSGRSVSRDSPTPFTTQLPSPPEPKTTQTQPQAIDTKLGHPKQASSMMQSLIEEKRSLLNFTGMDGSYDYDASSSDDEDGYKSDADAHEDVEMEVESAASSTSVGDHTTIHAASFGMRTPVSAENMGRSSSPQSPHPVSHTAVVAPISPALSIATDDIGRDMVTPVRPHTQQMPTPLMTPISPAAAANMSKQVRFVMPNSKNGMRKNPSGVLETGLAKMKSGNARKPSDVFGSQEKR
ncbi:uncharacterized protein H6S33_009671 [Morchella sextelata]|uniref:uncharacterized protein n=1 Tax=Morchella sextelata TaxID=1174677 RepID=UPI001D050A60|nr:uncharacterized protein H6S33_009671 [Morchella sextelata]KAH0613291.1 hypothetical protein H6S33_009671 [Morchella sextelata]